MDTILESLKMEGDKSKAVSELVKKGEQIVPTLLDIFKQDSNIKLRRGLAYAVSRIASQTQSPVIKDFLLLAAKDDNKSIKWFGCYGLGNLQFLDTLDNIIACMSLPNDSKDVSLDSNDASAEDVRRCAAEAAAKFGVTALSSLKGLLTSDKANTREAASLSLARMAQRLELGSSERIEIQNILADLSENDPDSGVKNVSKAFLDLLKKQ
ncbi:MAG: HEAT repeat domain-containing protein [Candidatus Hermodarchaeota archaeon]